MFSLDIFFIRWFVLVGSISYVLNNKHLLSILLRLEFIVLGLFFILFYMFLLYSFDIIFILVFLTFRVCEGALGLSILVSMIRTHGNDYFQSFSVL